MIELTRLNGEVIYLNYFQIQFLERIPETKVKMVNGDYYLVKNTVEDIQQKVADFFHRAVAFETKVM
ncbi:MAG: flagellar FlbD family protein [Lachnospiraceae bacterium]|nr:flagellar FlbD family protein [Lachnospiraceae bacterium]